jgi:hypothetical protein
LNCGYGKPPHKKRKQRIKLLDVAALTEDLPNRKLRLWQVGTVVELLDPGVFEVEFTDNDGAGICTQYGDPLRPAPRPTSINLRNSWWKDYAAASKAFPGSNVKDQSDPSSHEPRNWESESLRYWW